MKTSGSARTGRARKPGRPTSSLRRSVQGTLRSKKARRALAVKKSMKSMKSMDRAKLRRKGRRRPGSKAARQRLSRLTFNPTYKTGYAQAYDEGFNSGFAKGYEDGLKM